MNTIQRQIIRARRRLLMQRFLESISWSLFGFLLAAVVAIAVPKIWALDVDDGAWLAGWLGGSVIAAVLTAGLVTWWTGASLQDAAVEVDHRFRLKERLSSSLSLGDGERQSEAGQALMRDAERRASEIEVKEQFRLHAPPRGLLALLPVALLAVLVFVPDATRENVADASARSQESEQVKAAAEQLKKRLEQQRKKAEAEGLKDANDLFKKIEAGIDELAKKPTTDRKEALVKLNDLKQELEERRKELGGSQQMRRNLSNLKDLHDGPAEKVAKSLEKGDFGKAEQELRALAKQLRDGELTAEQQQKLAEQMKQMEEKLREAVERHEQAKKDLERQIEQAQREGRLDEAGKLQEKLDQLKAQDRQMQKLKEMANGLGQCQQAMQNGDAQSSASQLSEIADQLGDMQAELDQLEDLDAALDQLSQAKEAMRCSSCSGGGCSQCNGGFGRSDQIGHSDWAKGQGTGSGFRDEEESETGSYESQVRDKPRQGKAVASGVAGGPNRKGATRESVKDAVLSALSEESDPLEDRPLPRNQREHAREYFDQLRGS